MLNTAFILGDTAFEDIYGIECLNAVAQASHLLGPPLSADKLALQPPPWLDEMEVLFTGWGGPQLDAALLTRMPRLRVVFHGAGTIRAITSDYFWERGIGIASAAAQNSIPVVEFTLGAILLSFKRAWQHAHEMRSHRAHLPLRRLPMATGCGATIGLVSLGLIGAGVAARLRAFDVKILAHDPLLASARFSELGVEAVSLEELFDRSDIVSLHTPLLPDAVGMVDKRLLARLKTGATFINTARGGLVNEPDLIACLRARPDVQAIIDVTDPEPPTPDSALYDLPNVFLTPHIAGSIGTECRRMGRAMIDEFHRYECGEALHYAVTKERLVHRA